MVRKLGLITGLLALVFGQVSVAGAEERPKLSASGLERIYTCAEVAHRLAADDASAQDIVIKALEQAYPEVRSKSGELHLQAKQKVDAMLTDSELRQFDREQCTRAVVKRII
ncbi:MAG: hypothetical protein RSP_03900 [Rhodanobacter sp.]